MKTPLIIELLERKKSSNRLLLRLEIGSMQVFKKEMSKKDKEKTMDKIRTMKKFQRQINYAIKKLSK